jgi:hypothetical protein
MKLTPVATDEEQLLLGLVTWLPIQECNNVCDAPQNGFWTSKQVAK